LTHVTYSHLTDENLNNLIMSFRTKSEIDSFRVDQYNQYIKDGYYPAFKPRNGMATGKFVDIDVQQCTYALCLLDQRWEKRQVSDGPLSIPLRKSQDPRRDLKDGDDYPVEWYNDVGWCNDLDAYEFDRYKHEALLMLRGVSKEKKLLIPYAGLGAAAIAAQELGFKDVIVVEPSECMRQLMRHRGILANEVLDVHGDYSDRLLVCHRMLARYNGILNVFRYMEIIVCDTLGVYPGCRMLQPLSADGSYAVASNLMNYLPAGIVTFNVNETKKYEFMNPDIIVRFRRYCFVGLSAIPYLKFLLSLDISRVCEYVSYGVQYDMSIAREDQVPTLYIVGNEVQNIISIVRPYDAIYSVILKRELSGTYLSRVLPTLGLVSENMLNVLGFQSRLGAIPDAVSYDGMICSTVENVILEAGFPYLFYSPVFKSFKYKTGNVEGETAVEITKYMADVSVVVVKREGYVRIQSPCIHPTFNSSGHLHDHVFKVLAKKSAKDVNWLMHAARDELVKLPRIFTLDTLQLQWVKHRNALAIYSFIKSLDFDVRVKVKDGIVFNPSGYAKTFENDAAILWKLESDSNDFGVAISTFFNVSIQLALVVDKYSHLLVKYAEMGIDCIEDTKDYVLLKFSDYCSGEFVNPRVVMSQNLYPLSEQYIDRMMIYDKRKDKISWVVNFI